MAEEHAQFTMYLESTELDADQLVVVHVEGHEEISRPFVFRVLVHTRQDVPLMFDEFESLMRGTATLSFGPDREHAIHGVVRDILLRQIGSGSTPIYELTFVPRFTDLQMTRGSWIYLDKGVDVIMKDAFKIGGDKLKTGTDYDIQAEGLPPPREYIVQYEESAFNFISRQAEHWGIHYYFDHLSGVDKMMFGDMNSHFAALEGFEEIPFEPRSGVTVGEKVRTIGVQQRMVEHQVFLRDYNYRIPSVELFTAATPVDATGIGDVHIHGEHYWTPGEGTGLAGIRAQELFARKRRMRANTTVRGLRAGHKFTVVGLEPEAFGLAREYVVVRAHHRYQSGEGSSSIPYQNELELLPSEIPYRPARHTPRPRIDGVMHAKIDAESDHTVNVPVDEWGRYKVVMPFDVAGKIGGKASCWIRLATSAGGAGWGFAQGLHNKTEVVIYHIGGDPDRPVIGGSVMNFEQPAVVTSENANQCVVSSRNGISMKFSDA